ncbi:hypothetical protein LTR53_004339 [Teratosphaeriaceae sp. CCFEE 6253]|nr:hypothetical protein LTR53_004339 [Teratosphaeriaceae sp. CCFEE 6253]
MAFPRRLLTASTWRHLGLGTTIIITALGSLALLSPLTAADTLGVTPTTPEGRDITAKSMVFLGARDLAIAGMLFWLHSDGKGREMGVVLTSFLLVCGADTYVAAQGPRGWDAGIWGLCAGAGVIAFVGIGLLQG